MRTNSIQTNESMARLTMRSLKSPRDLRLTR